MAVDAGEVVGTIGLMRFAGGFAVLKKFFVQEPYRGAPHHLGRQLYSTLLAFAEEKGVKALILDTPKNTGRAHKFYKKAGFQKVEESELPFTYDHPYEDSDFFTLAL